MLTRETRAGVAYGVAAYSFWGLVAAYFKLVSVVPPLEILAHRVVWSILFLAAIITFGKRWATYGGAITNRRTIALLAASSVFIAVNWLVFIWAVTNNRLIDSSLGYFLNPLVNIVLGFLVLGERLRKWEWVSVAFAAAGVTWLIAGAGVLPWISLILAVSFGLYGLLRKLVAVTAIEGLAIETTILLPIAIGYLAYRYQAGTLAFAHRSLRLDLLLVAAGPMTALPLLWFAAAVRRLRLATVGLLQYISPTIQFVLAVFVFGEAFGAERLVAFVFIWIAIAIYSASNIVTARS